MSHKREREKEKERKRKREREREKERKRKTERETVRIIKIILKMDYYLEQEGNNERNQVDLTSGRMKEGEREGTVLVLWQSRFE